MDESLDQYISRANFKVKIGPSTAKSNPIKLQTAGFQGKRKFTQGFQGKRVSDVSITVPGVKKVPGKQNNTNQVRDAREKLLSKPKDARDRLKQKTQGSAQGHNADARQKLITIRAQKPVDARAKIQAKKQHQQQAVKQQVVGQTKAGNFTLTRTVSNQSSFGAAAANTGDFHITKTLTKIMPPGYEETATASNMATSATPVTVTCRLGPPRGATSIPNIRRTVPNSDRQADANPNWSAPPYLHNAPTQHTTPVNQALVTSPGQPQLYPPPTATYPTPLYPPSHQDQVPTHSVYLASSPVSDVPQTPPYPTGPPSQQVHNPHPHLSNEMPKIQVQNDQYRQPAQQMYPPYMAPHQVAPQPHPHYAPPSQPEYGYAVPQPQPVYYQPPPQPVHQDPYIQRTVPAAQHSSEPFMKTIVNDAVPQRKPATQSLSPVKRNYSGEKLTLSSGSGPLRSSNKNYVPIIGASDSDAPRKKFSKISGPEDQLAVKRLKEDTVLEEEEANVISPLQGYKIVITNLAASVTQEDIIELFGAIGPVKTVKMVKTGLSEVTYVKREDAVKATNTYHDRELDGQPMVVKVVTSMSAKVKEAPQKLPPTAKPVAAEPLKFSKKPTAAPGSKAGEKKGVEVGVLHKALFKTGASGPTKPVTFTVNI